MNRFFSVDLPGRLRRSDEAPRRQTPCRPNALGKMNLPPLMGRRDAAYDEASRMLTDDLFASGEELRRDSYKRIGGLLRCAATDTTAILSLLSSPDTAVRERKLLAFFSMLAKTVAALEWFVELESSVFRDGDDALRDFKSVQTGAELARGERMVAETEQDIVNQLRNFFERTQPRVMHYRGYARKNFSPDNACRYERSFLFYLKVYHDGGEVSETAGSWSGQEHKSFTI